MTRKTTIDPRDEAIYSLCQQLNLVAEQLRQHVVFDQFRHLSDVREIIDHAQLLRLADGCEQTVRYSQPKKIDQTFCALRELSGWVRIFVTYYMNTGEHEQLAFRKMRAWLRVLSRLQK